MFVGRGEINTGMKGNMPLNPGALCAGGQADLHLREVGHLGTAPPGRSLSERPHLLCLDPSFLTDFCGPETFLPLGTPSSIRNRLKSYFITVSYGYKRVSVVYEDIFLQLKAYFSF